MKRKRTFLKKRTKIILVIFVLILVLIAVLFFCLSNRDLKYQESIQILIGEELPTLEDYIDSDDLKRVEDSEITWSTMPLEDGKIYHAGTYEGYFSFRGEEKNISVVVIDDVAPSIEGVRDITVYKDETIDLLKDITVTDNSHDEVETSVSGDYDLSAAGEYALSYVARDASGNEATENFKLIVKEKEKENPTTEVPSSGESQIVGTTSKGYTIEQINGLYYIDGVLIANKSYTLPSSYNPGGLLDSFQNAFSTMQSAAANEGISLSVISGYRSYSRQNTIYNNYVSRDGKAKADTYSARAGHSEHQTGLAADINSLSQSFKNTKEGQWLNEHCSEYGFIIRYPEGKESITGYIFEPWHIRYVGKELASALYNNGDWITLEEYFGITSQYS